MENSCKRGKVTKQVKQLVCVRDRMDEWLLERGKPITLLIIFVLNNVYVIIYTYVFLIL